MALRLSEGLGLIAQIGHEVFIDVPAVDEQPFPAQAFNLEAASKIQIHGSDV